ncbi:hypothetical protein EOD41_07920 [Mucilaginibacter limnophilus]|uniref:YfhO family protein n=1 Tax=Mucilaginibacter limnophilus TaxID=1932778 RepID=A0A437MW39_9SPHI|nr:YfhO family protein [Mucilaginibacter limnophilus]RVU01874.1 hypothetical protein EOD41_07920 [Mucilaginibacter limnophilus]
MNNWFKRNSVHFAVIAVFIVISFAYVFSPLIQGKALYQHDVMQAQGSQKEIMDVKAKTGKAPLWTNSMFGGMPAYQIWAQYPSNITTHIITVVTTVFPNPVGTILLYLLGAYMLLSVLRITPWAAAAGAIAFAFSSYNFIIINAGHANQALAIAFFAPILAGIILALRGKYLLGASLTALFLALEIRSNHLQMTYYLMISILLLVGFELYRFIKENKLQPFLKSIGYLAAATVLAIAVNAGSLWTTYEYGKETTRGQSNLTKHTNEPAAGLDRDYAFAWSQGISECFTFLIPNAYGGESGTDALGTGSHIAKVFEDRQVPADQAEAYVHQLGFSTYWGEKTFTGGPFYFGAGVCFLFILGLLIVRGSVKWWLLATVVLTMLLSFGKFFTPLNYFFFDYVPLYNKFRAVESILAVAGLCFPLLAFLAVQEILRNEDKKFIFNKAKIALYITGGISLLFILLPDMILSFKAPNHQQSIDSLTRALNNDATFANSLVNALVQDRIALARHDAIRSLIFIIVVFGLIWAYLNNKLNATLVSLLFVVVTLADMWTVDKRFLNDSKFIAKEDYKEPVKPREIDQMILRDPDPHFRVFDLSMGNPFQNAATSFFYKSIGGYHAAKLKRFDELIDMQFSKSINHDVLDMLNVKYVISTDEKGQARMQNNGTACGNAWFVQSVKFAKNADEEMQAISSFDPKNEAIVDQRYKNFITEKGVAPAAGGSIKLVSYNPEHMVYESGSTASQIAVFSEIYYDKGWKMLIDGEEKPYFRADYLLRAAQIPVGNHKIEFIFHPNSYYAGEKISLAGSILLVLALGGAAYVENRKKGGEKKTV